MEKVHRKFLSIGILLFWFIMFGLLSQRHYGPLWKTPFPVVSQKPLSFSEEEKERWMGIYLKGQKIGYAYNSIRKDGKGYMVNDTASMNLRVMGSPQKVETATEARLGTDYKLESFNFRMSSDITSLELTGEIKENKLKLTLSSGADKSNEEIPLKDDIYLESGLSEKFGMNGLKPGKRFRALVFDPSTMSQQELNIAVEGKERIKIMGLDKDAYRMNASFKGINIIRWVDEKGEILKEESPLGFVMVKESKKDAMGVGPVAGTDIIAETVVLPNITLKNPERVSYLKLRLKDIPLQGFFLSGGRQFLKGDILEIKKEDITRVKTQDLRLPVKDKSLREFLEPTLLIQSKDQRIVDKAKDIIGKEKDQLRSSMLLMEWVYKNIEKRPTVSIPNALEVLRMKQGDCNEHTTLFTALARSAGIPTKIDIGLVYSRSAFYYHAWPEVFVGEWVSLDPTLNQFPADGTHIKFLEGDLDKQVEILRIVGKLSIEILEYR